MRKKTLITEKEMLKNINKNLSEVSQIDFIEFYNHVFNTDYKIDEIEWINHRKFGL